MDPELSSTLQKLKDVIFRLMLSNMRMTIGILLVILLAFYIIYKFVTYKVSPKKKTECPHRNAVEKLIAV